MIDAVHELGNAEQAERQRDQFDAVIEFGHAEGVALRAGLEIGADRAEKQAEHRHGYALDRRAARQRRSRQQAEQHERADFGRTELQRRPHQQRRQEDHLGDAPGRADERGDHREAERDAAAALLGHREAVEAGHRVRRVTWQIEQDRADRAAVLRAIHDAGQHQDGADRLHPEGERQQDRDSGERTHARQHADHVADQHADEAPPQIMRLQRDAEAVPEVRECGRDHRPPLQVNIGMGTCRK